MKSKNTALRRELMLAQNGLCHYCGRRMRMGVSQSDKGICTVDHRVPACRGGKNCAENRVGACRRCNEIKGVLTEEEFRTLPALAAIIFNEVFNAARSANAQAAAAPLLTAAHP